MIFVQPFCDNLLFLSSNWSKTIEMEEKKRYSLRMQCNYERESCSKVATKWFTNIISHKLYHMFSFPLFSKYSFINIWVNYTPLPSPQRCLNYTLLPSYVKIYTPLPWKVKFRVNYTTLPSKMLELHYYLLLC